MIILIEVFDIDNMYIKNYDQNLIKYFFRFE